MIRSYSTQQIRAAESAALARVSDGTLMRRAAWAVANVVLARLASPVPGRPVVLLVGGGNNGGDALYAGVFLRRRSVAVTAVLARPERAHAGGLAAFRRAGGRVVDAASSDVEPLIASADVVLDGLVGIGARPPLRTPMDQLVTLASSARGWRIAVDVPSGVDPDTGRTAGPAFAADVTITIGGAKTGLWLAREAGDVQVAPIGMDPAGLLASGAADGEDGVIPDDGDDAAGDVDSERGGVTTAIGGVFPDAVAFSDADVTALVPHPGPDDTKYSPGVAGLVAGSERYPGAAILATGGAVRLRPGLVRYAGPQVDAVVRAWPEVVATQALSDAGRVQAWAVGPGMGTDGAALARLRDVLAADVPVIVDADGLTLLAQNPSLLADRVRRGATTVLTPHAGEFARLFDDLDPADRLASTRAAATRSGAIVLLKGHRTVIADPGGGTIINRSGSAWLATAGSGDVLTGMIVSLVATTLDTFTAVGLAAHLHGRVGERAAAAGRAGASALIEML